MTLNGAIMQLVEMRENSMMPVAFKPYFDKVIETISECVEPSEIPQWIPCSERLPEPNEFVLVQNQNLQCFVFCMREEEVWYDYDFVYQNEGIIAWMPLPEAWRGGGDGR